MGTQMTKKPRGKSSAFMSLGHIALAGFAVMVVLPMLWAFVSSFKNNTEIFDHAFTWPAEFRWSNWIDAWNTAHIGTYFFNTVIVVFFGVAGTMLLGSMAAYVLARYEFRGNRFIYYAIIGGLGFPVFLGFGPLFKIVQMTGDVPVIGQFLGLNSYVSLVLVYIAYSLPFTVFFLASFFKTLPGSVAEAAMIDGCSHTRLFFRVMLPMAKPGLVGITIFNVIGQWNQYMFPTLLISDPDKWQLTQGIARISTNAGYEAKWGPLFAGICMAIIPMIFVYAFFQRQIQSGLTQGAVK